MDSNTIALAGPARVTTHDLVGELQALCIRSRAVPMIIPVFAMPHSDLSGQRVMAIGAPARVAPTLALPDPFLVEDYVLGIELLGFQFSVMREGTDAALFVGEPEDLPDAWDRHALRLRQTFGRDRHAEAIAFLDQREVRP